jgi:hypothetical protein
MRGDDVDRETELPKTVLRFTARNLDRVAQ